MFTRFACDDPFTLVPVLSLVVVGIFFHWVVPCFPVILIRISTLSPVVSVGPTLAPAALFAVGIEPMIRFIVKFVVLRYRVSIASMEAQKRSVRRSAAVCSLSPNLAHRLRGDELAPWCFHCFHIVCPGYPSRVRLGRT